MDRKKVEDGTFKASHEHLLIMAELWLPLC